MEGVRKNKTCLPQKVPLLFTHPLRQTLSNSKDVDQKHLNHLVNINVFVMPSRALAQRARESSGAQISVLTSYYIHCHGAISRANLRTFHDQSRASFPAPWDDGAAKSCLVKPLVWVGL